MKNQDSDNSLVNPIDLINKVIQLIFTYGMIDGSHHKQWILDQILRILLLENYNQFIIIYNSDKDYADWDIGNAP
jgi:hypothetical protein